MDNTHELAQQADPTSRVVHVDNNPLCAASRPGPQRLCERATGPSPPCPTPRPTLRPAPEEAVL
ncbi:hypothetical protein AB0F17_07545 [Nonomuraea sp. NPDC026600]|uniref:hypothetical protein n=1 Tax=Nonomuraea sp. NPDC026600 TaxID=3155363 RepID=UPI0034043174